MPNFGPINGYGINGLYTGTPTTIYTTGTGLGEVNAGDEVNFITVNGPEYLSLFSDTTIVTFRQNVVSLYDSTAIGTVIVTFRQIVNLRSIFAGGDVITFKQHVPYLIDDGTEITEFRQRVET